MRRWEGTRYRLTAGREPAGMGECHAEVFVRINWSVVDADFVVKVRPGGASAFPDVPDHVAAMHVLASSDAKSGKVTVAGADPVSVVDHDGLAVSAHVVGKGHNAVSWGDDGMAEIAADIDTAVECSLTVEWIDALAEAASHLAFNRP